MDDRQEKDYVNFKTDGATFIYNAANQGVYPMCLEYMKATK